MDIRKVQITGGSTYIVSLPKAWIRSVGIKANDSIGIITQQDGTLLVTPKIESVREHRVMDFELKDIKRGDDLLRDLLAAYIKGYDGISIKTKKRMTPKVRGIIRRFTEMTIGPEIVEESRDSVLIKDLLDPTELSFKTALQRMSSIVSNMHRDAMIALENKDLILAEDIISRDWEVDRLYWLVARQYALLLRDVNLALKMKTSREGATTYFLVGRIVERIGDHAVRMAESIKSMPETQLNKKNMHTLNDISKRSLDIFNKSIESLFLKDRDKLKQIFIEVENLIKRCESFEERFKPRERRTHLAMGNIIESIRRCGLYSKDICEVAINHLIDQ